MQHLKEWDPEYVYLTPLHDCLEMCVEDSSDQKCPYFTAGQVMRSIEVPPKPKFIMEDQVDPDKKSDPDVLCVLDGGQKYTGMYLNSESISRTCLYIQQTPAPQTADSV